MIGKERERERNRNYSYYLMTTSTSLNSISFQLMLLLKLHSSIIYHNQLVDEVYLRIKMQAGNSMQAIKTEHIFVFSRLTCG